jgi:L-asparaginase
MRKRVLILYTGGTFGMQPSPKNPRAPLGLPDLSPDSLKRRLLERVPEIEGLARCEVEVVFNRDSAHLGPDDWCELARRIQERGRKHDGVVVLHGTDTLSYTASALSFLLKPCSIPVVMTGAQRPLAAIRSDARRNLISAVEIAAHGPRPLVQQVTVLFDDHLYQGNRSRKRSASDFHAFESPKCPPLGVVGTSIRYMDAPKAQKRSSAKLKPRFSRRVATFHVTPAFPAGIVADRMLSELEGLVLVIFPSGTAPTQDPELKRLLREARARDIPVVAVTEGNSEPPGEERETTLYTAGQMLREEGAFFAGDMTVECAYIKTALILGQPDGALRFGKYWNENFAGEGTRAP